jgi:hypothetical protein
VYFLGLRGVTYIGPRRGCRRSSDT